jgi:peptidoglycan hydrolase-like protein with peptidoglycan-binding domain
VIVLASVALLSLVAGVAIAQLVVSPAELAARAKAPEAGPIFAPVEQRVIENRVTARADVGFADAVDVTIDTSGLTGPAVVTGHVPEAGAEVTAGGVALEVAGRPVLALPGALPAYRTLRAGLSGPDVLQLKAALAGLGIDAGDTASSRYDPATAAAVDELYRRAGYPPPAPSPDTAAALRSAQTAERAAESAVGQARAALARAASPAPAPDRLEAENGVRQAQRALDDAVATGESPSILDRLRDELALAAARRDSAEAPGDTSAESAALDAALEQLADAQRDRSEAETDALTALPAAEVVYLPTLPRRVDSVQAVRGELVKGSTMSVSGAALDLVGTLTEQDAALVKAGMPATYTAADGTARPATVTSVTPKKAEEGEKAVKAYELVLDPEAPAPDVAERLRGGNVRVDVPVQATQGAVLAVPVAALSAGPGGESRVELAVEHPEATTTTVIVTVTTGLAAGGYAEVRSDDDRLVAGARVVVGR